ncbi:hypothetical protein AKJ47_01765 [candidate division MSBL1 archaeon SCGC-AAA261G05]|uniref:Integrase n=2 Tax=candidate division MSBL1 TaxID=215777 RepID=A0A133VBD4_9EURY|nr:hypothetical protein AKJ47_01765 [candidate division MSBL1 archaeon SCGC-AAA261G05]KXB04363.1 hypothetical protein AKJ48_02835 [candidate division MSBL1 archaeon SCGC-AAA261O19]
MPSEIDGGQTTLQRFGASDGEAERSANPPTDSGGPSKLEEEYLEDCEARLTDHTVESHRTALRQFRKYLGGKPPERASKLDVRKFLNELKRKGRARSTISHRLGALRSFFGYIEEYHNIDTPDLYRIRVEDYPESKMEGEGCIALTKTEIRKLIEAASSLRDTLIVCFLYYLGLRAKEVATLKVDKVDPENRVVEVVGKGDKIRKVPLPAVLGRPVRRWLRKERRTYTRSGESPYFFPSKHGEHLRPKSVRKVVDRLAEKAGIQEIIGERADGGKIHRVHPHALRRSFATHGNDEGIPLEDIKRMMGHEKIETTLTYTKESIEKAFESYHTNFEGV